MHTQRDTFTYIHRYTERHIRTHAHTDAHTQTHMHTQACNFLIMHWELFDVTVSRHKTFITWPKSLLRTIVSLLFVLTDSNLF
jgi:hypothetical protein